METMAPIVLFTYNRLQHTEICVEALKKNLYADRSDLYVYSDAAKDASDSVAVDQVRKYLYTISGFNSVHILEREKNVGLARNIIDGVTDIVNRYGRIIVLEDDLVTAPYFLKFMNEALEMYKNEKRVCHIHACDFVRDDSLPETFLIKWTGSWGWATWDRAWKNFNPDGRELLSQIEERNLCKTFDLGYHFTRMLKEQIAGKNNSWAIRWNASLFVKDLLSLNVGKSLVKNIGFDGSGTHCGNSNLYDNTVYDQEIVLTKIFPIEENVSSRAAYRRYYERTFSIPAKIKRRLYRIFHL